MKRLSKLGTVMLCVIVCCLVFTGCSGNGDPLAGNWSVESASVASSASEGAVDNKLDQEELMKQLGVDKMTMTFKDGKVDMLFGETESEGTYTLEDNKVVIQDTESNTKLEGTLDGNTLTIQQGTGKLLFKKQ